MQLYFRSIVTTVDLLGKRPEGEREKRDLERDLRFFGFFFSEKKKKEAFFEKKKREVFVCV